MSDQFYAYHDDELTPAERAAIAQSIAEQDNLELLTVGIDIGSSTSHLLFARILLRREVHDLSSRFVVVHREIEWRSPILLTPFVSDGTIDADELRKFFEQCYRDAGFHREDVDSGAVILTGEAIKRSNARAIDEIFASESGKFVCATAGHRLESMLAALGSGAVELSRSQGSVVLHVDIGGGTSKLALIVEGRIQDVSAIAVGGRLLAKDDSGAWTRIDESACLVADELGISATPETLADPGARSKIVERLAVVLCDQIVGGPVDQLGRRLELTDALRRSHAPDLLTFSGGVAECLFGHEAVDHGDIASDLAAAVIRLLGSRTQLPITETPQRIRATVIGASQFTVQVSGKTIYLSDERVLPVQNIPVIRLPIALDEEVDAEDVAAELSSAIRKHDRNPRDRLALAFAWTGAPTYQRLAAVGRGILDAISSVDGSSDGELLVLAVEGDVGQSLGRILRDDLGLERDLVSADGIELRDLDYIDIGQVVSPPGVLPIVIKSLVFS